MIFIIVAVISRGTTGGQVSLTNKNFVIDIKFYMKK